MKVLLISSNTERINMVTIPVGLGLVAAATRRAGHEVALVDLLGEEDPKGAVRRAVEGERPEVIGISVRNIDDQVRDNPRFLLGQVKPVVEACRAASDAPVVLGGAGYSIFPAAALAFLGADIGVAGDGELQFPVLLERLRSGGDTSDLPGVHLAGAPAARPPLFTDDLDSFPLWDVALDAIAAPSSPDLWIPLQSRRGCPNDCSYCSTASIQGRRIRSRSPRLVAELLATLLRRGCRRFYFVDNSFNIPDAHALELCRWIAELAPGATWRCILYPHLVREELVRAMAASGCVEVSLGFESGSEQVLRAMNKRFTPDDVRSTSNLLRAFGIRRMGFLLLGGPGETPETVEESFAFVDSLDLDALKVTAGIRIYPGTPLARQAVSEGVIASDEDLLSPRFYLAPGLEPLLRERLGPGCG
jgi:radical SAM superfamily enzyme YgiQ (UPF0313 family)